MSNVTRDQAAVQCFQTEAKSVTVTVNDDNGDPIDLTSYTLRFIVYTKVDPPVALFQVENANIAKGDGTATVAIAKTQTTTTGIHKWVLWDVTNDVELGNGDLEIKAAVKAV